MKDDPSEIIAWLRSPEGEAWSRDHHREGGTEYEPMIKLKDDIEIIDERLYVTGSVGFSMLYLPNTGDYPV